MQLNSQLNFIIGFFVCFTDQTEAAEDIKKTKNYNNKTIQC